MLDARLLSSSWPNNETRDKRVLMKYNLLHNHERYGRHIGCAVPINGDSHRCLASWRRPRDAPTPHERSRVSDPGPIPRGLPDPISQNHSDAIVVRRLDGNSRLVSALDVGWRERNTHHTLLRDNGRGESGDRTGRRWRAGADSTPRTGRRRRWRTRPSGRCSQNRDEHNAGSCPWCDASHVDLV